jgi:hypothetical protein
MRRNEFLFRNEFPSLPKLNVSPNQSEHEFNAVERSGLCASDCQLLDPYLKNI